MRTNPAWFQFYFMSIPSTIGSPVAAWLTSSTIASVSPYRKNHRHVNVRTISSLCSIADRDTMNDNVLETNNIDQDEHDDYHHDDFSTAYHAPVMAKECVDALLKISHNYEASKKKNKYKKQSTVHPETTTQSNKDDSMDINHQGNRIFIDGTLGGGGHSFAILQRLSPGDILIGSDVDPSALTTASTRLQEYIVDSNSNFSNNTPNNNDSSPSLPSWDKPIFIPIQSNFKDLERIVRELVHPITGQKLLSPKSDENNNQTKLLKRNMSKTTNGSEHSKKNTSVSTTSIPSLKYGVDGILLDLGVSSHQIDTAERGFAFMKNGPLDMRMWNGKWVDYNNQQQSTTFSHQNEDLMRINGLPLNTTPTDDTTTTTTRGGLTAADICNNFSQEELIHIFKLYGDEPRARPIAKSIIDSRPLHTTQDLYNAVSQVTPEFAKKGRRLGRTATMARIFQSLRIVVNEEDSVLYYALEEMAPSLIGSSGRLVVLSYHSMEDRAVKRVMRDGSVSNTVNTRVTRQPTNMYNHDINFVEKDIYGNIIESKEEKQRRPWKALGKKLKATDDEIEVNSRARSATLRVAERR